MQKQLTFSSSGQTYTATAHDIFMDNGVIVAYIKGGKTADPAAQRIQITSKEWQRIKPQLSQLDYEQYYGRKPLLNGVSIYQIKN